ncbi:MAG: hemerythrin [Ignavibacteriales bacterium CG18_big_fil_WC_8_21_14_2_50_31_20]|nr:MAG: hemerythrin [Ignavibacteriales bacterium CG18_big_fil_WC_8_21_14_2_50_31_20]
MSIIDWDESYSVKINLIDGQHKKLFDLTNQYHKAFTEGRSQNAIRQLIDGLLNYAAVHFATEERYFSEYGYPETESHKHEHKIFNAKIAELTRKRKTGEAIEHDEVIKFMRIWLEGHIKGTDHKYIDFFAKNGLR